MVTGLRATNERQDDGTGVLHQVAQFPIDKVLAAEQVDLCVPQNPPTHSQRSS